jgi:hypothetical protein
MKTRKYFLIAIMNSLLFLIVPDYFFWFLVVVVIYFFFCLIIVIKDIIYKTEYWKQAFKILAFGTLSYILGILSIMIRNYFLGYYKN